MIDPAYVWRKEGGCVEKRRGGGVAVVIFEYVLLLPIATNSVISFSSFFSRFPLAVGGVFFLCVFFFVSVGFGCYGWMDSTVFRLFSYSFVQTNPLSMRSVHPF